MCTDMGIMKQCIAALTAQVDRIGKLVTNTHVMLHHARSGSVPAFVCAAGQKSVGALACKDCSDSRVHQLAVRKTCLS